MQPPIPFDPNQSPLVLLDLLFKLHIRDVMSTQLITARRSDTLRKAQELMRTNRITGLPVVEEGRLYGIISMDDIIHALGGGWMDDPVEQHMSRHVVVLEADMPLSFGVSYFEKFQFGRFPVLDQNKQVVGMLTSRDVSASLLVELHKEYLKLEARLPSEPVPPGGAERGHLSFAIKTYDFEQAGRAAHEIKRLLAARGMSPALIRRAAVAAYEAEMNMVLHSHGGTLDVLIDHTRLEITARDRGPGIPDVQLALEEGYSTANDWIRSLGFGAGMGLANIRRVSDDFALHSTPGGGTTVRAVIRLTAPPPVSAQGSLHASA